MTRRRSAQVDAPGQDSFLDIVSNLVGILIILVMVVGVQARNAMVIARPETNEVPKQEAVKELKISRQALVSLRDEVTHMRTTARDQQMEVAYRKHERDNILNMLNAAERQLDDQKQQLSDEEAARLNAANKSAAAEDELENLRRQISAVESSEAPTKVIKHIPTPLAKTVFGQEIHFRLKHGRLVFVPLDELVEKFKREARGNAWKLRDAPNYTDMVGPLRGFHLKYTLKRVSGLVDTPSGRALQDRVELDHFDLIPVSDQMGEPLELALTDDSEFSAIVRGYEPKRTTVTVWVYPDSFSDFRRVRDVLYRQGYLTASRPLPEGRYISGSPSGSRSAAQ